jgi:hypothetical protein
VGSKEHFLVGNLQHSPNDLKVSTNNLLGRLLPVEVRFESQGTSVIWVEAAGEPLAEPFFAQTVERLLARKPKIWSTPLRRLIESGDPSLFRKPDGFVFHISRCGSTLVSNALRDPENSLVISEASPISELASISVPPLHPYPEESWNKVRESALASLFNVFGQRSAGPHARLFIKFASWNTLALPLFRTIWPHVPCMIVVRDPLEVLVSNLSDPGSWAGFRRDPSRVARYLGWSRADAVEMPIEEYGARVIGSFCTAAAKAAGGNCKIIDYDQLNAKNLLRVREFFGLPCEDSHVKNMDRLCGTYSKDPSFRRAYRDDSQAKREAASQVLRDTVDRFAHGPYRQAKSLADPNAAL